MNKMKMRILAIAAAAIIASETVSASARSIMIFADDASFVAAADSTNSSDDDYKYFDPEMNESEEPTEGSEPVRYDEGDSNGSKAGFTPDYKSYLESYYFDAFDDIANLYTDTHLYSFTKEELMDAFIRKLIKENPYLFKLFLNTMLSTMDPYSAYHETESGFLNNTRGVFGFSIYSPDEFERKATGIEKGVYVQNVVPGSGAEKAGLAVGDKLVAIGEFNVEGLPFDVVRTLVSLYPFTPRQDKTPITINTIRDIVNGNIKDPEIVKQVIAYFEEILTELEAEAPEENADENAEASEEATVTVETLSLSVERNGEKITFTVEKSPVPVSPVTMSIDYEKKIAVISITSFGAEGVAKDLFAVLENARRMGIGNYIIDLRNNGGGYANEALEAANLFIEKENELLFYMNSRSMDKPQPYMSAGTGRNYGDIVILVNENTASASELFAMILRDNANAVLVGTTTYGKAVGQSVYTLMNGDLFTVTDTEILDTGLRSYNGKGLTPNYEIDALEMRYDFPEEMRDMALSYEDYLAIVPGEYSEGALALEKYLSLIGYLDADYADGIFDENTTKAINGFLLLDRRVADGVLTEDDINELSDTVNSFKAYFYTPDTQYMVAKMYFSSASQAKRLTKELYTAAKKAANEKKEIEEKYYEMIKEQEEEEKAQAAEATVGENAEA